MTFMHKEHEHENPFIENLKQARIDEAMIFPHNQKCYEEYLSNYQGVHLSQKSIAALGKK